jgi:hypothetical protein
MNATGVKLNAQELRNAEFYGRFKTSAYKLAMEQLNRWRDWRIFTPDQIARMNEVELTSELMILIINGTLEKTKETLDKYYEDYDAAFPDRVEVESRIRTTFDTIDESFGKDVMSELFRNKTLFYALFATIYGVQFGLRSPAKKYNQLSRQQKHASLKRNLIERIKKAASDIKDDTVPQDVLKAARGATTHASQRRVIIRYLAGRDNDPCPPAH